MDKKGFDIIDKAYKESLAKIREKIEREVRDNKKYKGFKFSPNEASWKLSKHPYSFEEKKRASKNHDVALSAKEAAIQAEIKARLEEPKTILEKNHFGDLGKQHALENAMREEAIIRFKNGRRCEERLKEQQAKSIREKEAQKQQEKKIIEKQSKNITSKQDNSKPKPPLDIKRDFKETNKEALAQQKRLQKIQAFKVRRRRAEKQEQQSVRKIHPSTVQKQFKNHAVEQNNVPQHPPKAPKHLGNYFNTLGKPPEPDNSLSANFKDKSRDLAAEAKADKIAREEAFKARKREESSQQKGVETNNGYDME